MNPLAVTVTDWVEVVRPSNVAARSISNDPEKPAGRVTLTRCVCGSAVTTTPA